MITDPFFFAVTIPAVLIMEVSKGGFGSGLGIMATPLVALAVPAPQAAAIMLPILLVMDATGPLAYRGTFVVDPNGKIKSAEIHDLRIEKGW